MQKRGGRPLRRAGAWSGTCTVLSGMHKGKLGNPLPRHLLKWYSPVVLSANRCRYWYTTCQCSFSPWSAQNIEVFKTYFFLIL